MMINLYLTGAANWETGNAIIGPARSKEKEYALRGTYTGAQGHLHRSKEDLFLKI